MTSTCALGALSMEILLTDIGQAEGREVGFMGAQEVTCSILDMLSSRCSLNID